MRIYTLRQDGRTAPLITVDAALASHMQAKGWTLETRDFDKEDERAKSVGNVLKYMLVIAGILACAIWLTSAVYAYPKCPVDAAGAGKDATACIR